LANIKENLIKLTDYPFTYSVVGSIFVLVFNTNINPINNSFNEFIPVLIFIGIIGTIISIIDPIGRLIKYTILFVSTSRYLLKTKYNVKYGRIKQYFQSSYVNFILFFGLFERDILEVSGEQKNKMRIIKQWSILNVLRVLSTGLIMKLINWFLPYILLLL
jgi:hypothetical protein